MITILNTSILTNYGRYDYCPLTLEQAKALIADGFVSAIGHKSTAELLTTLLGVSVSMNRVEYRQEPGQSALVFKLKGRPEEGKILTIEEIESIGYEFGLLTKHDEIVTKNTRAYYGSYIYDVVEISGDLVGIEDEPGHVDWIQRRNCVLV